MTPRKPKSKRNSWSIISMEKAIEEVKSKKMTYAKASNLYNVPCTTLKRLARTKDPTIDKVTTAKLGRKPRPRARGNVDEPPGKEESSHTAVNKKNIKNKIIIEKNSQIEEKNKSNVLDIQITNIASYSELPIVPKQELLAEEEFTLKAYFDDINIRINISKCLNEFYKTRILPSFDDLYEAVKNMVPNTTLSDFEKYMTSCGYFYHTMPFGDLLMEDPKITFERFFYLEKIIKLRQKNKQNIYYIDQRIVDVTLTFQKPSLQNFDDSYQSPDDTVLLYLVCSNTGKATGIFTNNVDIDIFSKWITDVVVDVLDPKSIVIMDDIFKQAFTKPEITMFGTKDVMIKWLKDNSIPCTNNMRKPELYELYKKSPKRNKTSDVKTILEAHGHNVLYVPTSLSDLCPTNYLWNDISKKLAPENRITLMCRNGEGVSELINKITSLTMPVAALDFIGFDKSITHQIFDLDAETERYLDELMKRSE